MGFASLTSGSIRGVDLRNAQTSSSRALFGSKDYIEELGNLDLQLVNKWTLTLDEKLGGDLISQLYVYSVTIPSNTYEYESDGAGGKYLKNVVYPESITMTFLEDEQGTTLRYLKAWENTIGATKENKIDKFSIPGVPTKEFKSFVFADNQSAIRRNAILQLNSSVKPISTGGLAEGAINAIGQPLKNPEGLVLSAFASLGRNTIARIKRGGDKKPYPKIKLNGLQIQNIAEYSVSQAEGGNLIYTVTFAIDKVKFLLEEEPIKGKQSAVEKFNSDLAKF